MKYFGFVFDSLFGYFALTTWTLQSFCLLKQKDLFKVWKLFHSKKWALKGKINQLAYQLLNAPTWSQSVNKAVFKIIRMREFEYL